MSYSFYASGATKQEALTDAEAKFDRVCQDMPVHEYDKSAVLAHLRNLVQLAAEPEAGQVVHISMNGYMTVQLGGTTGPDKTVGINAGCGVSVGAPS